MGQCIVLWNSLWCAYHTWVDGLPLTHTVSVLHQESYGLFFSPNLAGSFQNGTCWKAVHFNCMGVRANGYYALTNTDWEDTRKTVLGHSWQALHAVS